MGNPVEHVNTPCNGKTLPFLLNLNNSANNDVTNFPVISRNHRSNQSNNGCLATGYYEIFLRLDDLI